MLECTGLGELKGTLGAQRRNGHDSELCEGKIGSLEVGGAWTEQWRGKANLDRKGLPG